MLRQVNAIAVDRKVDARYVVLGTRDQTVTVVAAPDAVVRKAVDAGLLMLGEAETAAQTGKAFEERVLKSLDRD